MAWLESPGTQILTGGSIVPETRQRGMYVDGSYVLTHIEARTRSIMTYRNLNMTQSAATTFATDNASLSPRIERQNEAGAYCVDTTVETSTAWTEVA